MAVAAVAVVARAAGAAGVAGVAGVAVRSQLQFLATDHGPAPSIADSRRCYR